MQQTFELVQHQSQRLIMTQTLQQAIQLLQMSSMELRDFVQEAVTENPLLEWPKIAEPGKVVKRQRGVGRIQDIALLAVEKPKDLHSILSEQLRLSRFTNGLRQAAACLIDNLDERGYLASSLEELAAYKNVPVATMERALAVIQTFEPTGIGARSLQECLTLQMAEKQRVAPETDKALHQLALAIIKNDLEALASGRLARLQARYNCDRARLEQAVALIRTLDPHPGSAYASEEVAYMVPDLAILPTDQQFVVVMYDHAFPSLRFNEYYRTLAKKEMDAKEKEFFTKKMNAALSLLRSIEARRRTVFRVAEALVEHQKDFFNFGATRLKPLTMKTIAEVLHLHESTVSRAVAGKFAETPQGVVELKSLFSTALAGAEGDQVSAASVRQQIKQWIAEENPKTSLTDQELADRFESQGIQVSRRTVAKYRDELHIPSSAVRKRKFTENI